MNAFYTEQIENNLVYYLEFGYKIVSQSGDSEWVIYTLVKK